MIMDYEKKYKDALERARNLHKDAIDMEESLLAKQCEIIFPELRESEDEKIRKGIIKYLYFIKDKDGSYMPNNIPFDDMIAWLEKQAPVEHFELKKGHWYMCHRAYCCRADHLTVKEGERFQCEKDGIVKGFAIKDPEKYFIEVSAPAPMEDDQNDEVRRRSTIQVLEYAKSLDAYNQYGKEDIDKDIAWLEKQGEQKSIVEMKSPEESLGVSSKEYNEIVNDCLYGESKSADKVEPKFHEGEWLCENEPNNYARFIQILETVNVQGKEKYRISRDIHNDEDIVEFDFVEKYYHKFDIKDAKDGDVLVSQYNKPFIYNGNRDSFHVGSYCGISVDDRFNVATEKCHWTGNVGVYPATKEQCDLLFAKMKESGYEWDSEKKELKKIHVIDEGKAEMDYCFTKMMNGGKVSPVWGEEDNDFMYDTLSNLTELKDRYGEGYGNVGKCIDWLKSLKQRIGG
jgi:hypothetical protein